jgi:hypothetical protein
MFCLRADLRHKARAAVVRTDEITRASGQPAGDFPVRRCGRCPGAAAPFESRIGTLAGLVSRRDAAQGNGVNSQGLVNNKCTTSMLQEQRTEADEEFDTVEFGKELERVKWFSKTALGAKYIRCYHSLPCSWPKVLLPAKTYGSVFYDELTINVRITPSTLPTPSSLTTPFLHLDIACYLLWTPEHTQNSLWAKLPRPIIIRTRRRICRHQYFSESSSEWITQLCRSPQ